MKTSPHIVVIGGSNMDMVARAPRLPGHGETVLGDSFAVVPGGKGANQAVAAARLGARVALITRLGVDSFGDIALSGFTDEGIDTSYIVRDEDAPTGIAMIGVSSTTGENCIIAIPGANANLSVDDVVAGADLIRRADAVVCQFECPVETIEAALRIAREAGVRTILNPAPAVSLPASLLALVTVLTPNETESRILTGNSNPADAARVLRNHGIDSVIVTLGAAGALVCTARGEYHALPRAAGAAVDTTAPGDCFTGALAVALAEGATIERAADFANAAAAISVTRHGAQQSLPTRAEVNGLLSKKSD